MSANSEGAVYLTSTTGGLTLMGKGSTNDLTFLNSGGTPWLTVPTGTTGAVFAGTLTATLANVATTSAVCFNTGTGLFTYDGTIGTCNVSRRRDKHDIRPMAGDALDSVMRMRPVSFFYNESQHASGPQLGLIAEDLAAIDQRLVGHDDAGEPNSIRFLGPLHAYEIGAIQQLQAEIEALRSGR